MKLLDRLLHKTDHEEWLRKHPGKEEFHLPSMAASAAADQKRTREHMGTRDGRCRAAWQRR
jgi:hypothetical protein